MTLLRFHRLRLLALAMVIPAAACGDDDRSGTDLGSPDGSVSGDTIAPTLRSTEPSDGDTEVTRSAPLVLRFSEPMDLEVGSIVATPGGPIPMARWTWDRVGSTLSVETTASWAAGEISIAVTEFQDPSGNVMEPYEFTFETVDDVRPFVLSSTPTEDETGVSANIESLSLTFSEQMDETRGTVALLGGASTVGGAEWSEDGTVVTFPLSDLEYDREYDAEVRGFRDVFGNLLDPEPYLVDGILDFTTREDDEAPIVVRADPGEGTMDVNPGVTRQVLVTFNEPMDETVRTVEFSNGTETMTLDVSWTDVGRLLRIPVEGLLEFDTRYSIDLSNMRDRRGNPIDETTYLLDGSLDFTVSNDVFDPFVSASTPAEAEIGVDFRSEVTVELTFSEAMDQTFTTVVLSGDGMTWTLDGTWLSSSVFSVTLPSELVADTTYSLDLTMLQDLTGNGVDTTHMYLGDGILDFTTAPPGGENCRDALTAAQATLADGVYTWEIDPNFIDLDDGGTNCRWDDPGVTRDDAVILYEKVSADRATSGKLLRVTAVADLTSAEFAIAISSGACDPAATMDRCLTESQIHDVYLDLPAGPVQIWLARSDSAIFDEVTVTVSEVDAPLPEGEACDNPFTVGGTFHSTVGGADRWIIPENYLRARDISPNSLGNTSLVSCDNSSTTDYLSGTGVDGVIRYPVAANTALRVTVDGDYTASSLISDFNVSAYPTCEVTPTTQELYCEPSISTLDQTQVVDVPTAGDVYFWITNEDANWYRSTTNGDNSNREVQITIEPIPLDPGDFCSSAYAGIVGANAVTGTSDAQVVQPSCFGTTTNVEFYRVTADQALLSAAADAAGGIALFLPGQSADLACSADGLASPVSALVTPGSDVCVAVEMGQGITNFNVATAAYNGVGLVPAVDLPIERPVDPSGVTQTITADKWMTVSNGRLVFSWSTTEMMEAAADGAGLTLYRGSADGLSSSILGNDGLFNANGALFALDDTTSTTGPRIWRLWDGRSPIWDPLPWDSGLTYHDEDIAAGAMVGNTLYYMTEGYITGTTTLDYPRFYALDTSSPGTPVLLGVNTDIEYQTGLAADDTYLYVAGELDSTGEEGVFRIPIANPSATPVNVTPGINIYTSSSPSQPVSVFVSGTTSPSFLYVRNALGHVEAVLNPAAASPAYIGEVIDVGGSSDYAMWLDQASGSLYLFETDSESTGNFLRFDTP